MNPEIVSPGSSKLKSVILWPFCTKDDMLMCIESNSGIDEASKGFPFDEAIGLKRWLIIVVNSAFRSEDYQNRGRGKRRPSDENSYVAFCVKRRHFPPWRLVAFFL